VVCKNWDKDLPEDGTNVPKYVGEAHLMSCLLKNEHVGGKYTVYADKHTVENEQL